jgi:hypothetical protein
MRRAEGRADVSHADRRIGHAHLDFELRHIGHFAASSEAICKALFLGGVTRRFPELRFAFLEGGVAWACSLYMDLIGHWEKRNRHTLLADMDPATRDEALMRKLFHEYGRDYGGRIVAKFGEDEWARCEIASRDDIRELFVPRFFFGCEGDDRLASLAYDTRKSPTGSQLHAIYGSDLGHFDLPDMRDAAYEAWELVEDGLISEEDFRNFVFVDPVRAKTEMNPDFFKGTRVERDVQRLAQ